ncbi:MAG: hypothetical protein IH845_02920 [Nanoarchaeota archaeon]|nr:hypothetical protein [Nanoarchaeota archaeon]
MNKENFELYNYLNVVGNPKEVIDKILEEIPYLESIGYAGYKEKKWLKITLDRLIPDKKEDNQNYNFKENYKKEIKTISEKTFRKCQDYIKEKTHIFLFPTFDKFTIEKMKGVSGYCPWNNTLLIFINFNNGWKDQLEETIIHELAHSLSPYAKFDAPIGSWIILEGIAEQFKDFIIKGKKSLWVTTISKKESFEILKDIKELLNKNDFENYKEIFYGSGKYPLWAGYAIGYNLIEIYLENTPNLNWNKLLRENPQKIIKETTSPQTLAKNL